MKTLYRILQYIYILSVLFIVSCAGGGSSNEVGKSIKAIGISDTESKVLPLKYAKYFSINYKDTCSGIKELVIKNTWNGVVKDDVYTIVPRDCTSYLRGNIYAIPYPVKSVVCMSSSHVAYLTELGEEDCIKGISGTRFIYNDRVRRLISQKQIVDIGGENLPNYELIISMKPDVVIAYGIIGGNNSHIDKLQKFGIRVLTIGDYLEHSPLGKLEYLKLFGELTGKRELADSIFEYKEGQYLQIKENISQSLESGNKSATKVIMNAPYRGVWYIPGNENYTAQLIKDAGGVILGAKENKIQSAQLSFEHGYQYALQADVWLHPNRAGRLKELEAEHPLFKNIPALKSGKVYNNTLRNTPEGGSDFWETGVVEPHIILQDLAYILNPELFENSNGFKYYKRLN